MLGKKLTKFSEKAIAFAKEKLDLDQVKFDHLCLQTASSEDYEKILKEYSDKLNIIVELPHAGRRITIAELKKPVEINGVEVNKLEISEPKPKRTVKNRKFDHMAFVVSDDFDAFVQDLKDRGVKINEEKQIGIDRLVKFAEEDIEIEIRNNRMGIDTVKPKEEQTETPKESDTSDSDSETDVLRKMLEQEKERKLRAIADYQNLQKRVEEERAKFSSVANADILADILDTLDDFDRALRSLPVEEKDQVGIRMVREKLQKIVDSNGLEEIECTVGDSFDPNNFEAVGIVAIEEESEQNKVKEVVQRGYKLSDSNQVVRPVKVIVTKLERNQ